MTKLPARRPSATRTSSRRQNAAYKLMVHGPEYGNGEELIVNPESFPDLKVRDIVEIIQPDRVHLRLVMQVRTLAPIRGKLQVSILKDLALQFQLDPFHEVTVQRIDPTDATVDFIELSFKDQFMSRADLWRYKVAMFGKCLFAGKAYEALDTRAQVEMLLAKGENVLCGVMGTSTKLILRSRSSRIFWLVQMSPEMWDFADDGEIYFEKLLHRFVRALVAKWHEASVSHSVTVLVFSRSFYDADQFPPDYDPTAPVFADECSHQAFGPGAQASAAHGHGPAMHVDSCSGRYYEDFYKVLIQDYTGPDWTVLIRLLQAEFASYPERHRWRVPASKRPASYVVSPTGVVQWLALPHGVPARAAEGNVLEAINVTLNVLDKHYMDRDLNRAGQGIVMLTAGAAVFHVPKRLAQITKQRMMDTGVGMDMVSLTTPPLHPVPLFRWSNPPLSKGDNSLPTPTEYSVPHWINVSFLDFDCTCGAAKKSLMRCHCRVISRDYIADCPTSFLPLPACRMLNRQRMPVPLTNILANADNDASTRTFSNDSAILPSKVLHRTIDQDINQDVQAYDDSVFLVAPPVRTAVDPSGTQPMFVPLKSKNMSFSDKDEVANSIPLQPRKRVVSMQNLQKLNKSKLSLSGPLSPNAHVDSDGTCTALHGRSPSFSPPDGISIHQLPQLGSPQHHPSFTVSSSLDSTGPFMLKSNRSAADLTSPRTSRHPSIETTNGSPMPSAWMCPRPGKPPKAPCEPFQTSSADGSDCKLTSNRRRWSHIFPWTPECNAIVGPNWKSLVNPAVLPLTTDFYPKDLHVNYTESFYSLMLLETKGHHTHQLLVEMICQRLASDFQLVEQPTKATGDMTGEAALVRLGAAPHRQTYTLSMGHRIHKLIYDDIQQTIDVKCYHKRLKTATHDNHPFVYEYSLYDPLTASFHKQLQTFHEFPSPEDNWNTTDNLLCGYVDAMGDSTKCRRIRFVVMPSSTRDDAKIQKLVDFLQSKLGTDDALHVTMHPESVDGRTCAPTNVARQFVRVSCNTAARMEIDCRNEWLMLLVDVDWYPNVNFHMDVRWLACSGTVVDDFVTTLRRKCKHANLDLRRVPEFTQVHHLHIHPCLSSVLLPFVATTIGDGNDADSPRRSIHAQCLRWGFVLDGAHVADNGGIGHGLMPKHQPSPAAQRHTTGQRRPQTCPETWKARGYVQYMHRHAPVFLRVLHHGVVWIPSYAYDNKATSDLVRPLYDSVCHWIEASTKCSNDAQNVP
ncbi:hypothetical protein, variant 2 [Aphanomyces invadans]|uniref:DEP domain-containing protein n=1 Tax=Aphanomyces invadans TaxID=157072 RepID=A0A024TUX8_9STRA|nr:hypothetical protein, variant 1 [Aphanomyces invadans]XP_008873527.1 hypothetical protein, variant 2 [Aphanomyces invadans]ETV97965.1 hypothetical protein, variant 1 [Aphanomyces invadans]ETV97966.1 hypothetical protein, variant 2 [Aphanomyces invadans]|eukprot:XP_008873526.1 hypothetical protein, variant 1 [Aphanomyces invadans]